VTNSTPTRLVFFRRDRRSRLQKDLSRIAGNVESAVTSMCRYRRREKLAGRRQLRATCTRQLEKHGGVDSLPLRNFLVCPLC